MNITPKKLILLNGGKRTESQMRAGLTALELERYRAKDIYLLADDTVRIFSESREISVRNSIIFNRFYRFPQFSGLLLELFSAMGAEVVNPIQCSYHNASEKSAQIVRSATQGIPVPKSIITTINCLQTHADSVLSHFIFPLVLKTDGMRGEHVHLCQTESDLHSNAAAYDSETLITLQEYIPSDFDIRIIVAYGQCLGAMKRSSNGTSFKHNVSLGGMVSAHEMTLDERQLAISAAKINRTDVAGVDILYKDNAPLFLELNHGFGVEGFESIHRDTPVAEQIAKIIEKTYAS